MDIFFIIHHWIWGAKLLGPNRLSFWVFYNSLFYLMKLTVFHNKIWWFNARLQLTQLNHCYHTISTAWKICFQLPKSLKDQIKSNRKSTINLMLIRNIIIQFLIAQYKSILIFSFFDSYCSLIWKLKNIYNFLMNFSVYILFWSTLFLMIF